MILPILGGGAHYSFKEKSNKLGPWSEIAFDGNRLRGGVTPKSIGILTELGDVPLAEVTLKTPGVGYLATLIAPQKYSDVAALASKNSQSFAVDGFPYASSLEATTETTYALRAIAYQRGGYIVYPNEPYYRLRQASIGYDGSDTLLAFRIVRRHEDGSITILWKRLQKFRAPKLKGSPQRFTQRAFQQFLERDMKRGMTLAQVVGFLDVNAIEHTEYVGGSDSDEGAPPAT